MRKSPFILKRLPIALAVLSISLFLTGISWYFANRYGQDRDRFRFEMATRRIESAIRNRMEIYINLLQGGKRFFEASPQLTRHDWSHYVQAVEIRRDYPGIQGLGFAEWIPRSELAAHTARIRREGFLNYRVWPPGDRPYYTAIIYLEPFDWRNRRAFGYDMFSEPIRREAMTKALETGEPVMSGKVRLVQETNEAPQAGFLIYLPVYQGSLQGGTRAKRIAALQGFVYSPFRANDLFRGILTPGTHEGIYFDLFDGPRMNSQSLLYAFNPPSIGPNHKRNPNLHRAVPLTIANHRWTLYFTALPAFVSSLDHHIPLLTAVLGGLVSCLLFVIVWVLASSQEHAIEIAKDMTADLRRADLAKDEFLSVISHELRTPLNFITGFGSVLNDEIAGPLNEVQHQYLRRILQGADRMLVLVNNLLDFSQMAAGKFTIEPQNAPLYPLIQEVVGTFKVLAEDKGIQLEGESPDLEAWMDDARICQVLSNLIDNAIKFTPQGRVHVKACPQGDMIRVEVQDTGIGIAEEDLPKLFVRFNQLDMSITRRAGGSGLGLSISKGIIMAHGGAIGAESTLGKGSTFWFTLSAARPVEKSQASSDQA